MKSQINKIKQNTLSLITMVIFLIFFFSKYEVSFFEDNLKNTYHRYKILTDNDKTYKNNVQGKFSFLYQVNHSKYPTIRSRYQSVNNFEFHPYWSIYKSSVIYDNVHPVFRVSNDVKNYITLNKIELFDQCRYYMDGGLNLIKLSNNNQHLETNLYKISSITVKPRELKNYQYIKIFSNNEKIADILLNSNDNWNQLQSDYSPFIFNLNKNEIVIDSFITIDDLIKIFVFTHNDNIQYELYNIDSDTFLELIYDKVDFDSVYLERSLKSNPVNSHNIKNYQCHSSKS